MLRTLFVVALTLIWVGQVPLRAEEEHKSDKNPKEEAGRPSADKKKSTLADKISACLSARPSSAADKTHSSGSTKPSTGSDTSSSNSSSPSLAENSSTGSGSSASTEGASASSGSSDGAALFNKHCSSCHSLDKLDFGAAAQVVGVSMPKGNPSSVPANEVTALKQFFLSKAK